MLWAHVLATLLAFAAPPVMVITHANRGYDPHESARPGIEAAGLAARRLGVPLYSLTASRGWGNDSPHDEPYVRGLGELNSGYSAGGEHDLGAVSRTVVLTGGYFEACLKNTFSHFVAFADWSTGEPFQAYFVLDGIYTGRDTQIVRTLLDEAAVHGALASDTKFGAFVAEKFNLAEPFEYIRGRVDPSPYRFEIWRGGRLAAGFGTGPNRVLMNFVVSPELDRCQELLLGARALR